MIAVQNRFHATQRQAFGSKKGEEFRVAGKTIQKQNAQVDMKTARELNRPTFFLAAGTVLTAAALWTATFLASPSVSNAKPATTQVVDTLRHVK